MNFDDAQAAIMRASTPEDLFGSDKPSPSRYRRLSRVVHPDAAGDRGHVPFARLAALWEEALGYVAAGTYGQPRAPQVEVRSKKAAYAVRRPLVAGDVAELYVADSGGRDVVLKVARSPRDADLLAAEAQALKRLRTLPAEAHPFFPELLDSFAFARAGTRARVRANVLPLLSGWYSLAEVRDAYPDGVDPKDAAWIARRVLASLGWAHEAGIVHGAVLPEHVMVQPAEHGLALVGWGQSVPEGTPIKARVQGRSQYAAPEVRAKQPATAATDLYAFGDLFGELLAWTMPSPFEAFVRGTCLLSQKRRPQDAGKLLVEFDDLLERMWGRRRFHEFTMPVPARA